MKIKSAEFVKSIVGEDELLADGRPQVAMIGRSNVGKSSIINVLTGKKDLARTSSFPGRTQMINVFLINDERYLLDLPGYGYAKVSKDQRAQLEKLIDWYLFHTAYPFAVVAHVIDADTGPTALDIEMMTALRAHSKTVVVVANKIDKIKNAKLTAQMKKIEQFAGSYPVIAISAETKKGFEELTQALF